MKGEEKNEWLKAREVFNDEAKKLLGQDSNIGVLTHSTNFIDLCNYLINYHSTKDKEEKLDFFTNIKIYLMKEMLMN